MIFYTHYLYVFNFLKNFGGKKFKGVEIKKKIISVFLLFIIKLVKQFQVEYLFSF